MLKRFDDRVYKNGVWLYLLQLANTVLPIITIPYITRIMGPSNYGTFSFAINIVGYLQTVIEYGFGMSASRKIVLLSKQEDRNGAIKLFSAVVYSRIIFFFICGLFITFFMMTIPMEGIYKNCICILFLGMAGYCLQQNWFFQGIQEMQYIAIICIFSRTISVVMIFLLIRKSEDILLYSVLYSVSPVINGILGTFIAIKKYKMRFIAIRLRDIAGEIRAGWNVFSTQMSSKIFGGIGITFLGMMSSSYDVGIYAAIQKIPNVVMLCWAPISQVLYPISSELVTDSFVKGKKKLLGLRRVILMFFIVITVCIAFFSKQIIILVLGVEYRDYYFLSFPLLMWVIAGINNNFLGIQLLLGGGFDAEYSYCFQISVVLTVIFNYVLIKLYGIIGAAIAPLISECILTILLKFRISSIEKKIE
ncbi:flippase [Butyrivibrio sp. AC2005]|uniref:flippase n=1 Tax=Butyrivibrio sp. AC2005 TaxID=1280672 RepID=UPI000405EB3A|nr:flippase [Butyrivibrio sp. AC2005]